MWTTNYALVCSLRSHILFYDCCNICQWHEPYLETSKELARTAAHLKSEFKMKDLGKTQYCLGLEIEHRWDRILVHQMNYTQKVLLCFNEDKLKPSNTHMVIRSLDANQYLLRPNEDDEEILEPEVPYLSEIGALLYLAQCTKLDIFFVVNLLTSYSNAPTRRHWIGVKDIFCYLKGTTNLGLLYAYGSLSDAAPPYLESILTLLVCRCRILIWYAQGELSNGLCLYRAQGELSIS